MAAKESLKQRDKLLLGLLALAIHSEEEAEDATIVEEETAKTESDSEQNDNTDSEEKSE